MVAHVSLFSNDRTLFTILWEAAAERLGSEFTLEIKGTGQPTSRDTLCVWDFVPGQTFLPQGIDENHWRRSLFLVEPKDVGALRMMIGESEVNVLLKPVDRSRLGAFLGRHGAHGGEPDNYDGITVTRLLSERDEVLQILMQANLKLQEFQQERTNFLARSIHDFRAPLTAISGYCELLLGDELEPVTAGQRKILRRMQHAARRLTRVTNAMSGLNLAEDAEPILNLERADIRDCIGQALEDVSAVLENKRVSVTVEVEEPAEKLLMEKAQIEQALGNLLESACKFTPRGGAIEIRGYLYFWERRRCFATAPPDSPNRRVRDVKTFNSFRVDISDSGPAIRAADADRIFEGHTSYSGGQDRSGAGLGLAICRMILNQHGGRVWAESSAAGAVFSLVLPFLPGHPLISEGIETEQALTGTN